MPRPLHRLTTRKVAQFIAKGKPGTRLADGGNLLLQKNREGGCFWIFQYTRDSRPRAMGLGPARFVTLAEAREKALENNRQLVRGFDPLALKQSKHAERAKATSFRQAAESYINAHRAGWKSEKHGKQWESTLATYAYPIIGSLPLTEIDTALVLKVVEPLWNRVPETGSRVRGRIETILDWATARGLRQGDNPARWKGHMQMLLPSRTTVQPVQHMAALPIDELPGFMASLRERKGLSPLALEFCILTASRSHMVIKAEASEFDLDAATWTIPGSKMKGRRGSNARDHIVPLGPRALQIARERIAVVGEGRLFDLHENAMLTHLRQTGHTFDVHGFRSCFVDWCAERNSFDHNAVEKALAHTIADKVEAAYRRGELLQKRTSIMRAWERFALSPKGETAKVVALGRR